MDLSLFPPPSYRPPIIIPSSSQHLSVTTSSHLLSRRVALSTWTSPTPATRHLTPLVSAPRAVFIYLLLFPRPLSPPLPPSACTQVPVRPWGFSHHRSIRASVTLTLPPCVLHSFSEYSGSWSLFLLGVHFRARSRG